MRVSFYTTCMARLHHLRETLPCNLEDNPTAEFIVLNYNSPDDLDSWIRSYLCARICYAREKTAFFYHSAHSKNVAAKLASGDILVNLDADTFAGSGLEVQLVEIFTEDRKRVVQVGRTGTVALLRRDFYHLRGYDERMRGWGFDDVDLIARASLMGLPRYRLRDRRFAARIGHSDEERERLMGISMAESGRANRRLHRKNRQHNLIQTNPVTWGVAELEVIHASDAFQYR